LLWVGLALAVVATGAGIAGKTTRVVSEAAPAPEPEPPVVALPPKPDAPPAAELAAIILARPPFSPRQPPVQSVVAPPPPPIAAPLPEWTWRLAGLMIAPGRRQALFTRSGENRRVSEGEDIDEWTLVAVDVGSVRLAGPDGERTLLPQGDAAVAAAVATDARIRADQKERRRAAQRTELAMRQLTQAMMAAATPAGVPDPRGRRSVP
jgi:hypothetical protein